MWKPFKNIKDLQDGIYLAKVDSHKFGELQILRVRRNPQGSVYATIGHHFHWDHTILEYTELPKELV